MGATTAGGSSLRSPTLGRRKTGKQRGSKRPLCQEFCRSAWIGCFFIHPGRHLDVNSPPHTSSSPSQMSMLARLARSPARLGGHAIQRRTILTLKDHKARCSPCRLALA